MMVASVDVNSMPEFKAIDEGNGEFFYISQRHPWSQREGIPSDPLNKFDYNNKKMVKAWRCFVLLD